MSSRRRRRKPNKLVRLTARPNNHAKNSSKMPSPPLLFWTLARWTDYRSPDHPRTKIKAFRAYGALLGGARYWMSERSVHAKCKALTTARIPDENGRMGRAACNGDEMIPKFASFSHVVLHTCSHAQGTQEMKGSFVVVGPTLLAHTPRHNHNICIAK